MRVSARAAADHAAEARREGEPPVAPRDGASSNASRVKALHVITGTNIGGAEISLRNLLAVLPKHGVDSAVVSLTARGPIAADIEALNVRVHSLKLRPGRVTPASLWRLAKIIRSERPDVLVGWMYHGNLAASLASLVFPRLRSVWGIHAADLDPEHYSRITRWIGKLLAVSSPWLPRATIFCSEAARQRHCTYGFAGRQVVIPNGFDPRSLYASADDRERVRDELGLGRDAFVVGHFARYDPVKDHETFFRAAAMLAGEFPHWRFLCAGSDVTAANQTLTSLIDHLGLSNNVVLLGQRRDVPRLLRAVDVVVSSSRTEAFPLLLGEAMLSEVPCVATDVGDSALIVADTGWIVPATHPTALAEGMRAAFHADRQTLGARARASVAGRFGIDAVAQSYANVIREATGA